jgi:hypothetical protein
MTTKTKPRGEDKNSEPHRVGIPLVKPRSRAKSLEFKSYGRARSLAILDHAPPNRKKFAGDWDELKYIFSKILYWYYNRANHRKAFEYRSRFKELLETLAAKHPQAIFLEECWSVLHELDGKLQRAIEHREREIGLILGLWKASENTPVREHALDGYGVDAVCDRLELLALLYHQSGNADRAIVLLVESRRLCESTGLPFEGNELLLDYLDERQPAFASIVHGGSKNRD